MNIIKALKDTIIALKDIKDTKALKKALKRAFKKAGEKWDKLLKVSRSNMKLVPNEKTGFIIWNLPAKLTCPYRTPHCELLCYARKAERMYPTVLPSRHSNWEWAERDDFVEYMTNTIWHAYIFGRKEELIVRIHESGDFYNQEYADKWLQIMLNCSVLPGVKFIAYTKSFPFFDGKVLPKNFSLRASVWDDTPQWALDMIERNDWPIYTAVEKFTDEDTFCQCRCEDCATCGHCWDNTIKFIACEIH